MQIFDYLNKEGLLHLIRKIMGRDVDLTQAEYDALPESKNSDGKNYYIYDSDIAVTAEEVGFDGSASGSTAANSQQALDELFAADKKTNESLENINSNLDSKLEIKVVSDGTQPDAIKVIENNWTSKPLYSGIWKVNTSSYTYTAYITNHSVNYGEVFLTSYALSNPIYGILSGGAWTWSELSTNKIIYQEYDVTTASNQYVALGNIGSVTITKDGYTPISASPNDDAGYQGFCNLRHYPDGTSVAIMISTSERTYRIRVWYKKD